MFFRADKSLKTSVGEFKLPITIGKEFLYEMHLDPLAQRARIWIDGKLLHDGEWIVKYAPAELPACFYFGKGTGREGGVVEVGEIKLGHKPF